MDKVLTRKLFKDVYLKSLGKNISNFNKGGLASLNISHFKVGGMFLGDPYISKEDYTKDTLDLTNQQESTPAPISKTSDPREAIGKADLGDVYTEGEKQAMLLTPIAAALLSGTRQPGQSQLGAVASNIGSALPAVTTTSMQIKKLENERLSELAKLAAATRVSRRLTDADLKREGLAPGTIAEYDDKGSLKIIEKSAITDLQKEVTKQNIPTIDAALSTIENKYKDVPATGRKIAGLGAFGTGTLDPSPEAKDTRATIAELKNIVLKYRSGSAVTENELKRLQDEFSQGIISNQTDFLRSMERFRNILEKDKETIYSGFKPEEKAEFIRRAPHLAPKESPFAPLNLDTQRQEKNRKKAEEQIAKEEAKKIKPYSIEELKKIAGE
jgi:hypothetical protein